MPWTHIAGWLPGKQERSRCSASTTGMERNETPRMARVTKGDLEMKALLISFAVGLLIGVVYGAIRVKSPAPPIVALLGLLGMVLGEQAGGWLLKGERKHQGQRPNAQSVISPANCRSHQ